MNRSNAGDYVALALAIAVVGVVATVAQSVQIVTDFDPDALFTLRIVNGGFATTSGALAMLCAVLVGHKMLTGSIALVSRAEIEVPATESPVQDQLDDI